ncbi:MAG: dinitrogenase iron-molybdenum cofactor biosynthesis protein [Candidatus Magnetoglobus multicellularis str. Araruama]|uniref:Dinitrogenase iron-molybdenum cofactor biosynthesis protein n=1 Tax=Candidatus Magnetoglobus multicellularis str. Araruama TaxID=890399 RepID=A0A1V1P684_9BACT|nr:MAG: dinitrogenase iron-molybdenum cofactor biosynthesis protein [Candidatus Magnetoglobus multicellularis str. Araruama]
MKIAISSQGIDLDAAVDPRFGRAANFILIDSETNEFEVIENKQNLNLPQGAGIQAGKTIVDNKAEAVITGNCGPKAFNVLSAAGVKIYIGAKGSVKEALARYKNGELQAANSPNVEGHWA